jgi:type 2 lantibiotic biosynthesis protein LanM
VIQTRVQLEPVAIERLEEQLRREGWSLHQRLQMAPSDEGPSPSTSTSAALQRWRELVAPDNPLNFEKRLQWDGLTEAHIAWALDPPPEATPLDAAWWPLLQELRQAALQAAAEPGPPALGDRGTEQPFVHVWRPAAAWMLQALRQRCADLEPALQLAEGAWHDLGEALLTRLCTTTEQALWELFQQRRTPGQMLLAHLGTTGDGSGEPVHEAYDALVGELLASGYGLLLGEFPVLGRLLAVVCQLWLEGSEEMLRRVAGSRTELQQLFGIDPAEPLQAIRLGLSDPHRGGRAVAILRFGTGTGGDGRKVVYKPKDMQVDATYQRLLLGLNQRSDLPPLRCLTVLTRDGYGFMEWVEHRPCSTEVELARFYSNAGRLLALLYVLGCTDCHHENLIARGEQLLLIDTETLLEADHRDLISDDPDGADAVSALKNSLFGSVLRTGLLPRWLMVGAGRKRAVDISALGIQPPPVERKQPGWLGLNSDGMLSARSLRPCELPTSLPVELGSPERLTDFVEKLCGGFRLQLLETQRLRPWLLAALEGFRGQPRRLVARNTRLYFTIQRQMLEPAALRSAAAQGLQLEQLCRSFVLAREQPLNWPIFKAEILQMERLDVPFFEHRIDGEELLLPEGLEAIAGFMASSGLAAAHRRLEGLDRVEIDFQERLIRGAIAARHIKPRTAEIAERQSGHSGCLLDAEQEHDEALACEGLRKEAFRLGEELWAAAILDRKGRPEWLGLDLERDGESFRFGLIGHGLYAGASGLALLFAALAQASDGEAAAQWRQRAWRCFEGLAEWADRESTYQLFRLVRDQPYGLAGTGGMLLVLQLIGQAELSAAQSLANRLIDQLRPERLLADQALDLLGGVAGLIGPLLLSRHPRGEELAHVCGARLLQLQLEEGGWPSDGEARQQRRALTGLSHGAAGIAAALATLAQRTGDERLATAASRAVAYERSVFNPERGNWPDFRSSSEAKAFALSWCHGAPGILLARQALSAAGLADEACAVEMAIARQSTLGMLQPFQAGGLEPPTHLCCGALGLTSVLRADSLASGIALSPEVSRTEQAVVQRARASGAYNLFSTDTGSALMPGFFHGLAGIAMALLEAGQEQRWLPTVLSAGLLTDQEFIPDRSLPLA